MAILMNVLAAQGKPYGSTQNQRYMMPMNVQTDSSPDPGEAYEISWDRWQRESQRSCGSANLLHQKAKLRDGRKGSVAPEYAHHWQIPVVSQSSGQVIGGNGKYIIWEANGQGCITLAGMLSNSMQRFSCSYRGNYRLSGSFVMNQYVRFYYKARTAYFTAMSSSDPANLNIGYLLAEAKRALSSATERDDSYGDYASTTVLSSISTPIDYDAEMQEVFNSFLVYGGVGPTHGACLASAYSNAVENLPQVQANMIMNVIELVDGIKNIARGNIFKSLNASDSWLKYRYVYNTTKSDIEELRSFSSRISNFASCPMVRSYGVYHYNGYVYRCSITYATADVIPKDLREYFRKWGFKISLLNIWDMVPYSFIVDWFLHISDLLRYVERVSNMVAIPVQDVWYSVSNTTNQGGISCENYLRLHGRGKNTYLPKLDVNFRWSIRTLTSRLADVGAIFFGK